MPKDRVYHKRKFEGDENLEVMNKLKKNRLCRTDQSILLSLIYSIVISVILLIIFCILTNPYFETNDDPIMNRLVERIGYNSDGLLIFQNIVYNKILLFLYDLFDCINWYVIVPLIFCFLSIAALSYIILRKSGNIFGIVILFLVLPIISYQFIHIFQFTRIAAFVSIAGIILLYYSLDSDNKREKIVSFILGVIILLFGSWFRFESMMMVAFVLSSLGIVRIIQICIYKNDILKNKLKKIFSFILAFIIAFSIPFAFNLINTCYYQSERLQEYTEFNELRANVYDYGFLSYDTNINVYKEVGISKDDLKYYSSSWNMDLSVLTNDNLKNIVGVKEQNNDVLNFFSCIKSVIVECFAESIYFYLFVFLGLLAIIFDKRKVIYVILQIFMIFLIFNYLYYIGRPVTRVCIGVYFAGIIAIMYSIDYNRLYNGVCCCIKKIRNIIFLCFFIITLIANTLIATMLIDYQVNQYPIDNNKCIEGKLFYSELSRDSDSLYVCDTFGNQYDLFDVYGIYETAGRSSLENMISLGGWHANWPSTQNTYSRYGVENIYKDCINNDHIFLILSDDSMVEQYIQEHYNSNAHLVLDRTIGKQRIFKVVT